MNLKKWLIFFPWLYFHLILAENLNDDNFSCDYIPSVSEESESSLENKKNFKENPDTGTEKKQAAKNMRISEKGIKQLAKHEGLRTKIYDDQTGKPINKYVKGATIGYGHLITSEAEFTKYKNGISEKEAMSLYRKDLQKYQNAVSRTIKQPLTQNQYDALVSLSYNIGPGAFEKSSVAKLVNNPNAKTPYKNLDSAWRSWNKSQGKVMKGLDNRRNRELSLFRS